MVSVLLRKECLQTIPRPPLPEYWQCQSFMYFGESGGRLHFIGFAAGNQNPDDLNLAIISSDMFNDKTIVVYSMEKGCSKCFVKYCLHMNAIVMAYPEMIVAPTVLSVRRDYCPLVRGTMRPCHFW
ncbi:unnamed protein product [Dovyalis caffra]|uniref:Uncharacterized protein n=1 Tax=Dovyalis caffra TaxID=77055 RepID=A0AAV1S411_9ROSI|nr:unnamed protein product [Dovyalis caffra]